jgi:alpha-mannosidase
MTYDDLTVLIPCHSLEDFPTELGDKPAEGLLNAFAVLWHPLLLAAADVFPKWARADDVLEVKPNGLVILPNASKDQVPTAWIERARRERMHVVVGVSDRHELVEAVLAPLDERPDVDPDLVADFLALGHVYLQTELLTRHMRQFGNIDEAHMRKEAVSAAKSAVVGDETAARTHLKHCFEMLLEARERFYPVDCYLIDLCLVIPRLAGEKLESVLQDDTPVNLMATAEDFEAIVRERPPLEAAVRERWDARNLDVIGGDYRELCTPLLSLESVLGELRKGRETLARLFGKRPTTWGRRRYGVGPHMPQLLSRLGYESGLHFVMDDGIYPDEEYSKLQWQGCDGSSIAAYSRLPLAGDSASAFLRFCIRMSESMDNDHAAGLVFARWPEMRSPWLEDFRRAHRYAPVLGRFVTFEHFFAETDLDGRMSEFRHGAHLTPFLVQAVARREQAPLTRYVDYWRRLRQLERASWCAAALDLLKACRVSKEGERADQWERFHAVGPDVPSDPSTAPSPEEFDTELSSTEQTSARDLASTLLTGAADSKGLLVLNPLAFPRKAVVEWPQEFTTPPAETPVFARQMEGERRALVVDVPACGFAWVSGNTPRSAPPQPPKKPLAESLLIRNEFFEVTLSELTGGIAQIRTYGRGGNRLSQQIAWRFPREKAIPGREGEDGPDRTWYSDMRMRESRVLCEGPALGAVETVGDLIDPGNGKLLGTYRQSVRVWRGRPFVEVDIELGLDKTPEGDPWTNYVAARFAWGDESLSLTRSLHETAQLVKEEQRIESPNFLELADDSARTTLLTAGLSFHRKTGPRMLDTLLVVEGEQQRRFRFGIAVDHAYPMQAALDFESPPLAVPVEAGPPKSGPAGWLFQVSAQNVQLHRVLPLRGMAADDAPVSGCIVRLLETEGRNRNFKLGCFRPPVKARQVDSQGKLLHDFKVQDGVVLASIAPYELCDIELRFA